MSEAHGGATAATLHVYLLDAVAATATTAVYVSAYSDNQGKVAVDSELAVTDLVGSSGADGAGTQANPWALQWPHTAGSPTQLYFRVQAAVDGARGVASDLVGPVVLGEWSERGWCHPGHG